jgi:tRNA pseudouridine38/39 synthase
MTKGLCHEFGFRFASSTEQHTPYSFMKSPLRRTSAFASFIAGEPLGNPQNQRLCFRPSASFRPISNTCSLPSRRGRMSAQETTDYTSWTNTDLIGRISDLERQMRQQNARLSARSTSPKRKRMRSRRANVFDPSKYATRHIALKIAYLGQKYNGFEHANGNLTPLPTIEEVLWKALRKACLISPETDETTDVAWSYSQRSRKPLNINWDGCQYSKCGRTDKGVSAFGQVIGIRVRSNRPVERPDEPTALVNQDGDTADSHPVASSELPDVDSDEPAHHVKSSFDPIKDELPYIAILNSILPSDIRVLAWCPKPPDDFDARFSCGERRYKYFFTNPGFLPTPGPIGLGDPSGREDTLREGWLDVDAMRTAAKKLVGLHDFRNLCRIDPSRQITTYERNITHVDIEEVRQQSGPVAFVERLQLAKNADPPHLAQRKGGSQTSGPKVYSFTVHGSAFLWHQVRNMAAVLFLVGQRLESPSIIDELLDTEKNPSRPTYEMASDAPLVLWDCVFPMDKSRGQEDELEWVYAGDARTLESLTTKGDGKYGSGGVVDEVWSNWRKHKIDETLASVLLDLVVSQGDGSAFQRGGFRDLEPRIYRSQKLFDGSETARLVGKYIPVMEKSRMETVDVQNARYRTGKGSRREMRRAQVSNEED